MLLSIWPQVRFLCPWLSELLVLIYETLVLKAALLFSTMLSKTYLSRVLTQWRGGVCWVYGLGFTIYKMRMKGSRCVHTHGFGRRSLAVTPGRTPSQTASCYLHPISSSSHRGLSCSPRSTQDVRRIEDVSWLLSDYARVDDQRSGLG